MIEKFLSYLLLPAYNARIQCKILSGKYDTNLVPNSKITGIQATRSNDQRIFKTRFKYDLRKFYFTNRVVDAWNTHTTLFAIKGSNNKKNKQNKEKEVK